MRLRCKPLIELKHSDCLLQFTDLTFIQMESDEDTLWKADIRETKEELAARGVRFLNWLVPLFAYLTKSSKVT